MAITADDVVGVAERIVEEEGLAALSVRRLGAALGVSRQVVYTHFGGVNGLLAAMHVRTGRRLADRVEALAEQPGTLAHVLATGRVYVEEARRRPRLFELAFGGGVPGYEPDEQTLRLAREAFRPIVDCARAWLTADVGGAPADDEEVRTLARVLWSVAHGHVTLELAGHAAPDLTDRLLERALASVVTGWRTSL